MSRNDKRGVRKNKRKTHCFFNIKRRIYFSVPHKTLQVKVELAGRMAYYYLASTRNCIQYTRRSIHCARTTILTIHAW